MSYCELTLKEDLVKGKSLTEYKRVLEDSVTNFTQQNIEDYMGFYTVICESDIPLDSKKALILGLVKAGIPVRTRWMWEEKDAVFKTLCAKDLPLLLFLLKKTPMTMHNGPRIIQTCESLGKERENNQFVINLLNKVNLSLPIQKAFLRGAIEGKNNILIRYIVEVTKPDLYIPTSQKSSTNALYGAIVRSTDLEILKYLESHGYNIHECQRSLLNLCYTSGHKVLNEMIDYILSEQAKSSAANEYTEQIANAAFSGENVELLEKFHNIKLNIRWTQVINILKSDKPLIIFKTALERYIERETELNRKYDRTWNKVPGGRGYIIFTTYHVNQVWKLAKDKKPVWECFKQCLIDNSKDETIVEANKKDGTDINSSL